MSDREKIRVLLVDDHAIVRSGLTALLEPQENIEVVGEGSSAAEAVQLVEQRRPDIILLDISLKEGNGLLVTGKLRTLVPSCRVILLTMHDERQYVDRGAQAGASGYVLKDAAPEELLQAIETVHAGGEYFSRDIQPSAQSDKRAPLRHGPLTPRETEILVEIGGGQTSREIAAALHISSRTVDKHRERIMRKLQLRNVAELVRYAMCEGLV